MKIAIMGAGLSGLSCAIILEKFGYHPYIFEKNSNVGNTIPRAEIMLPAFTLPVTHQYQYLDSTYGIKINPISTINHATLFSENKTANLGGRLGYINIRGNHPYSLEFQLLNQVKSGIFYDSTFTYDQLRKAFSHVIVATGYPKYVNNLQPIRTDVIFTIRGATVIGQFDLQQMYTWHDNSIAPKGLAFLIPFSKHRATIAIAIPSYLSDGPHGIPALWDNFLKRLPFDTQKDLEVIDVFQINQLIFGQCMNPKIGTTYFTGNCLSAMGPAFGFGQFNALLSGIYAALDISKKGHYNKLTKQIYRSYDHSLTLRRYREKLNNRQLDFMIRMLNIPGVNRMILSKTNYAKYFGILAKPFI